MTHERINPPTLAPPVMNLYSQIVVTDAKRLAFVAGQVAIDGGGALVGEGDYAAQAHQAFLNVKLAVEALGGTGHDVMSYCVHVVRYSPDVLLPIFEAGREVFGDEWPLCASMLLGIDSLALPEWLIEINATVAVG